MSPSFFFFFCQNVVAPGTKLGNWSSFVLGDLLDARQVQNWDLQILDASLLTSHSQNSSCQPNFLVLEYV